MKSRLPFIALGATAVATIALSACGGGALAPSHAPANSNAARSVAFSKHPHNSCAPTSITYGPVLVNGVQNSLYTTPILSVTDVSPITGNAEWEFAESIVNGPQNGTQGPPTGGVTHLSVYDFSGKLVGAPAPGIAGYATMTTDVYAWAPMPSCNLSKMTVDYSYTWNTYAVPFGQPAESGTMAQSASITYPAQPTPTPAPTSTPTPSPTIKPCTPDDNLGGVFSNASPPMFPPEPVASKPLIKDLSMLRAINGGTQFTFNVYFRGTTSTSPGSGTAEFQAWDSSGTRVKDETFNVSGYEYHPAVVQAVTTQTPCQLNKVSLQFSYTQPGYINSGSSQTDVLKF